MVRLRNSKTAKKRKSVIKSVFCSISRLWRRFIGNWMVDEVLFFRQNISAINLILYLMPEYGLFFSMLCKMWLKLAIEKKVITLFPKYVSDSRPWLGKTWYDTSCPNWKELKGGSWRTNYVLLSCQS
jgi:hypothetical protein